MGNILKCFENYLNSNTSQFMNNSYIKRLLHLKKGNLRNTSRLPQVLQFCHFALQFLPACFRFSQVLLASFLSWFSQIFFQLIGSCI